MKTNRIAWLIATGWLASSPLLFAQGVYVIKGENGPLFTDQPQSGAKEIQLQPLSVVPAPAYPRPVRPDSSSAASSPAPVVTEAKTPEPVQKPALPGYEHFSIVSPEDNGSIVANGGGFSVRLSVSPPLLLGEGHAFAVSVNGRQHGQRFTSTEFTIPPSFWGGEPPPPNQHAQLDVSIVDAQGKLVMKAAPVRFIARYISRSYRPVLPLQQRRPVISAEPKIIPVLPDVLRAH